MADAEIKGYVNQDAPRAESEGVQTYLKVNKRGELCVVDFYTEMALEGRAFQVRAGSLTTPLVGDVAITTAAAEMCADAGTGYTMIPTELNIAIRLGTGTLHEYAAKSGATLSTAGAAFVPLPLYMGGNAAACTARVAAAGGVTVMTEGETTTRQHFHYANPVAVGAGNSPVAILWVPRVPPVLAGLACFWVQIAATGTGPSYYANFIFIELPSFNIS